jgi:hypothetical protein
MLVLGAVCQEHLALKIELAKQRVYIIGVLRIGHARAEITDPSSNLPMVK